MLLFRHIGNIVENVLLKKCPPGPSEKSRDFLPGGQIQDGPLCHLGNVTFESDYLESCMMTSLHVSRLVDHHISFQMIYTVFQMI